MTVQSILDPLKVSRATKAEAWDAFHSTKTPIQFRRLIYSLPIPAAAKHALFVMKFERAAVTGSPEVIQNLPEGKSDVENNSTNQSAVGPTVPPEGPGSAVTIPAVPEGNGPGVVRGLPGQGDGAPENGQPQPVAGGEGKSLRRVTGSSDIPLSAAGEKQAERLAEEKTTKPFDEIISSPSQRSRATAAYFIRTMPSLEGWPRGAYEGEPVDSVKSDMARLIMHADEAPPGVSPVSGEPGQSWNQMAKPLFADVLRVKQSLKPDERALMVTSGGNLQAIDAWGNAGFPKSFEFDRSEVASRPYWSVTGKMFRLGKDGLDEVKDNDKPGLYFIEHASTAWNSGRRQNVPNRLPDKPE
jgi:broad specificity phosphatase PhoE